MNDLVFRRSADMLHSDIGNDVVALHVRHGICYGMENVTAAVWRMLDKPMSLDQLCRQLTDSYDVDLATCRSDIEELMKTMEQEGLVVADGPAA